MRDSVLLYRNQCDALRGLDETAFKKAVLAIWDYAMDDTVPNSDPLTMAMYHMARPLLDQSKKRAEAGRSGGKATQSNRKQSEANGKQNEANESKPEQAEAKYKIKNIKQEKVKDIYPCGDVISYLNSKLGTRYRATTDDTRKHIIARFRDGYTLDDFKTVIDKKVAEWSGTEWAKFLRPKTLFGPKFESYLNQQDAPKGHTAHTKFDNFTASGTDWDAVTALIMEGQA